MNPIKKIARPIKEIAKPIIKITRSLSTKLNAAQAARKAARKMKRQLSFINLNLPWISEVTLYTESHPSGINANIRTGGKSGRPDLKEVNHKLACSTTATRDFYYEYQENCRCSTAVSLQEKFEKDTRRVCKMSETVGEIENVEEAEVVGTWQSLMRTSTETQSSTSLLSRA